jgi:hypothetical protein
VARTKRGEGPTGSLGDDDLQQWLEQSKAQLGASGIAASFGRAPRIGGAHGPTWVTMTSATAYGRLVRAADGATTLRAHALPAGAPLLDETHPHTTLAQLDSIIAALSGAHVPAAGRA